MKSHPHKPDIRDVARALGVSATTVSHAINGKGRLSDETRERVRRAAADLGYRPSNNARNLVSQRTGILGLAVSSGSWEAMRQGTLQYLTNLMLGATTAALDLGYALVMVPSHEALGQDIAIDGAIIVDPLPNDPLLSRLQDQEIPVVTAGRDLSNPDFTWWVDNDHTSGARSVLDHLAKNGARRIALLTLKSDISYTYDTEQAYLGWCSDHGVEPIVRRAEKVPTDQAGFDIATELLALREPADAIFAMYSPLAYGAMAAAAKSGIQVPEDLMIIMTATEASGGNLKGLPITTTELNADTIGREAALMLIAQVEGRVHPHPRIIGSEITTRNSTKRSEPPASGE